MEEHPLVVAVEDEPILLDFYKRTLEKICEFHGFRTAGEAISFIHNNPKIALMIIDRHLPDMKGEDLCNYIRSTTNTRNLPIIIVSVFSDIEEIAEIMTKINVDTYITKPISAKILRDHVVLYLRKNEGGIPKTF